jgi:tripartite-type tricarboxylate transporter receptor subunit TctC
MKIPRRQFLHLAAGTAAHPVVSRVAWAQTYPSRPVRLVVSFPAGGTADVLGRLMGQWLSEHLGQPFIIENRPGAGSNLGTEFVVRAFSDGYTLLEINSAGAINATLYEKLNFNFIRDIAPVAGIVRTPLVMVVNPLFPAKTLPEFIAYAKANPGKINMASSGNGAAPHVTGELFKMMTGINMVHVPYRGEAAALTDLIGGQVQVYFSLLPAAIEHCKSGTLRPLAVTTTVRSEILPEVPAIGEFVPGFEATFWAGIGAPKNTPVEIIQRLNQEVNAGLADPKLKARFAEMGGTMLPGSPADLGKLIADETEKWGKVVKFAGIKAD